MRPARIPFLPFLPVLCLSLAAFLGLAAGASSGGPRNPRGAGLPRVLAPALQAPLPLPAAVRSSEASLLDEVGRLARPVPPAQYLAWKTELKAGHVAAPRAVQLHVWTGEFELAKNEAPDRAAWHFRAARLICGPADPLYGLAAYDTAIVAYYEGAYAEAAHAFRHLLDRKTLLRGYDRRRCALWLRHALACAGYHAERSRMGITEPPRLDPLCGAAGLAACLQALHLPYDRTHVLQSCRVTGLGSNVRDLVDAAGKLGLGSTVVTADEEGLKALPKPLIAYVEHDHFITVTGADARGVSYLCVDCGVWPGGRRELSWAQYRALEAGPYVAVYRKGSPTERLLAAVGTAGERHAQKRPGVRLAASGPAPALGMLSRLATLEVILRSHVTLYVAVAFPPTCGNRPTAQHCTPGTSCPMDKGGHCGASEGDPVNLATGEEEYHPAPDLAIYNPHGPDVAWQRVYNSLQPHDGNVNQSDFGDSWSSSYNVRVYDPATSNSPQINAGNSATLWITGTNGPTSGLTWQVVYNGSTVGSSTTPNGWSVSGNSLGATVGVPGAAASGRGYEARWLSGSTPFSSLFDVLGAHEVARAASGFFTASGTDRRSSAARAIRTGTSP